MFELVYTSAPRLLEAGKTGFGTLSCTKGMPRPLISYLERISAYDRGAGVDALECYTVYRMGSVIFHVFSRIKDCGADYTGRTNHVAHHFVVEEGTSEAREMMKSYTPVNVLSCLASMWVTTCPSAPQYTEERHVHLHLIRGAASAWTELTGSPTKARWMAVHPYDGACCLVFPGVAQISLCLLVLHEGYLHKPNNGWGCGFSTARISTISANYIPVTCLDVRQQASGVKPGRATPLLELRTSLATPPERPTWHPDPISVPTVAPLETPFSPNSSLPAVPRIIDPPKPDIIPPDIPPSREDEDNSGGAKERPSSWKRVAVASLLVGACCICGTYFFISYKSGGEKTESGDSQEQTVQLELDGDPVPQMKTESGGNREMSTDLEEGDDQNPSGQPESSNWDTREEWKRTVNQEKTENPELREQQESSEQQETRNNQAPSVTPGSGDGQNLVAKVGSGDSQDTSDQRETRGNRTPSVTPESGDDQDLVTKIGSGSSHDTSEQRASGRGYGSLVNLETDDYQKPSGRSESGSSHGASAVSNRSEDTEHWVLKDGDKGVKIKTVVEEKEEKYRVGVTVTLSSDLPAKEKFKGWNYYYIEMDGREPKEWTDEEIQLTKFWDVSFNGAEILPKYKIADIRSKLEEKLKVAEQELRKAIKGVGKFKKPKWGDVEQEFKEWEKVIKSEEKKKKKEVSFREKMVKKIEEFLSSEGVELEDDEGDESEDEEEEEEEVEESGGDGECTDKGDDSGKDRHKDIGGEKEDGAGKGEESADNGKNNDDKSGEKGKDVKECKLDKGKGDDSGKDKNKGSEKTKGKGKKETYQSALQRLCDATKGYGGALNRLSKENVAHLIRRTKGKAKEYLKREYGKGVRIELLVKEKEDETGYVTYGAEFKIRSESHEQTE